MSGADGQPETRPCPACGGQKSARHDLLCLGCWKRLPMTVTKLYHYVWKLKQADLVPPEAFAELERLVVLDASGKDGLRQRARGPLPSAIALAEVAGSPRSSGIELAARVDGPVSARPPRAEKAAARPREKVVGKRAHHAAAARASVLACLPRTRREAWRLEEFLADLGLPHSRVVGVLRDLKVEGVAVCEARPFGTGRPPLFWWRAA